MNLGRDMIESPFPQTPPLWTLEPLQPQTDAQRERCNDQDEKHQVFRIPRYRN
jgi:hypothetical protein